MATNLAAKFRAETIQALDSEEAQVKAYVTEERIRGVIGDTVKRGVFETTLSRDAIISTFVPEEFRKEARAFVWALEALRDHGFVADLRKREALMDTTTEVVRLYWNTASESEVIESAQGFEGWLEAQGKSWRVEAAYRLEKDGHEACGDDYHLVGFFVHKGRQGLGATLCFLPDPCPESEARKVLGL